MTLPDGAGRARPRRRSTASSAGCACPGAGRFGVVPLRRAQARVPAAAHAGRRGRWSRGGDRRDPGRECGAARRSSPPAGASPWPARQSGTGSPAGPPTPMPGRSFCSRSPRPRAEPTPPRSPTPPASAASPRRDPRLGTFRQPPSRVLDRLHRCLRDPARRERSAAASTHRRQDAHVQRVSP